MKKMLWLVACIVLVGCAQMETQRIRNWTQQNKPMAQSGAMAWSEYYTGLYNQIAMVPDNINGKGFYLQASAALIDAAKAYEDGKITKDDFESFQRTMTGKEAEYQEQVRRSNAQSAMNAAIVYNQFLQAQAAQAQAWRNSSPVNCTSYRLGNSMQTQCY
jgi:hypothetical protein